MGQMLVEGGRPEANLTRARGMIERAARERCRIVVLPECLDLGWTDGSAAEIAEPIPGRHVDQLRRAAADFSIYVVAGLVERSGDKLHNSAVLISDSGKILLKHRRISELDFARELYTCGEGLGVAHTPLGVIGVPI